jgi:hypothetical protein
MTTATVISKPMIIFASRWICSGFWNHDRKINTYTSFAVISTVYVSAVREREYLANSNEHHDQGLDCAPHNNARVHLARQIQLLRRVRAVVALVIDQVPQKVADVPARFDTMRRPFRVGVNVKTSVGREDLGFLGVGCGLWFGFLVVFLLIF